MPVIYNSQAIIPAPFVSVSKEYQTSEDGKPIGSTFLVTLKSKLFAHKGSPNSSGAFWTSSGYPPDEIIDIDNRLKSILAKQMALRQLFSDQGKSLEITPLDGSPPTKCNPRVRRIEFSEGPWYDTCDYTVTLECDILLLNGVSVEETEFGGRYVSKITKEWNFEILDETKKTFRLTHNVAAVGKLVYEPDGSIIKQPWQRAKDYVLDVIGLGADSGHIHGTVLDNWTGNNSSLGEYNYLRSQNQNEGGGSFSCTETWIVFDADGNSPAIDDCTITTRTSAAEAGRVYVSINGTITGLEKRDVDGVMIATKYETASLKYNELASSFHSRAETVAGETLNPVAITRSVGRNGTTGVITYNFEYDNRPVSDFTNAISQLVTVSNKYPADVFARIPVLGNPIGPILQDIGSKTESTRTINIEVQLKPRTMTYSPISPKAQADAAILARKPAASAVFVEDSQDNFTEETGKYMRTVTYTWTI